MPTDSALPRMSEQLTSRGNPVTTRTQPSLTASVPFSVMDVIDEAFDVVYVPKVSAAEAANGLFTAILTVSDRMDQKPILGKQISQLF